MKNQKVFWILLLCLLSRTILSLFAQGMFSLGSTLTAQPLDFLEAGRWWTVYGSLIDIGSLALMVWIVTKEGTQVKSIIGFSLTSIKRDVLHAGLLLFVLLPITVLWGTFVSLLIYGQVTSPILAGPLPLWGELYSVMVWPIGWAVMEQMVYMGYCLPKLVIIFKNNVAAVIVLMFFWALQHTVLPLTLDLNYSLYRFLTVIPMLIIPIYYLKTRRLIPLILVHALSDCISALSFYFLPNG
ncbi:CPBP family glutamic-type intramembrane protease [Robertmurraya sp. GLU-23]